MSKHATWTNRNWGVKVIVVSITFTTLGKIGQEFGAISSLPLQLFTTGY